MAGFLAGEIVSILNANCDCAVAAEQDTFSYNDLVAKTAHGTFTQTTKHNGTDSPTGCGSNSVYYVTWHMLETAKAVANHPLPVEVTVAATAAKGAK